jgi:monovalent cation:H+ antiporter-2, CPA2 family
VLEAAHVEHARLLVIAAPDGFQARRILELAWRVNPRIDSVVRTHGDSELAYLQRQGVGMALMGERELALGMLDYALRSFGLAEDRVRLIVRGFRTSDRASDRKIAPSESDHPPTAAHHDQGDSTARSGRPAVSMND